MQSINSNSLDSNLNETKANLIAELDKRVTDHILEQTNADLLKKLITNADSIPEAQAIAELGTTYKRTGLHFDKRLEKITNDIKYLKKNEKLSFINDTNALTHKLIIGDNYDALLNLLVSHKNSIDVIYIDPPYGIGKLGDFAKTNYNNAITRDNLLSMLYPRLQLAKMLLSDDGVIFCSIDDKNYAYIKCLFDEIFNDKNIETLIWNKEAEGKSGTLKQTSTTRRIHEYIICGFNNISETEFSKVREPLKGKETRFQTANLVVNAENENKEHPNYFSIKNPSGEIFTRQWKWDKNKIDRLIEEDLIYWGSDGHKQPRLILPTDERRTTYLLSILYYGGTLINRGGTTVGRKDFENILGCEAKFSYPKPIILMKKILETSTKKDSIVLDFFAGSGTTGQAVLDLNRDDGGNRQFILITNNEVTKDNPNGIAYDVTSKRLKRVMCGECYDGTKDFDWLKKNEPYGNNLEVTEIAKVPQNEIEENKTPFDVIDETLYGQEKLELKDKIDWVCKNFSLTTRTLGE